MDAAQPIRNVSDTALWVAIYRAIESERSDALFRDPYARRLGGERGEAIVKSMPGGGTAWPLVVRVAVMDEIVLRLVRSGVKTVLNLAAGLDARPYRLDLPSDLLWLHVDMPEMVDYFRSHMAQETPRCRVEFIAADLRDEARRSEVFARAAAADGPLLVITEGLLIYLQADDVAALARDLHDKANARWWLSDLASPALLRFLANNWGRAVQQGNAPFVFGPREGTAYFAPHGWREAEFRSTWDEAWRLNRKPAFAWLWRMLSWLQPRKRETGRRMSSIVLLESDSTQKPSTS